MKILLDLDRTLLDARQRLYALYSTLVPATSLTFDEYWRRKRQGCSNQDLFREQHAATDDDVTQFTTRWMSMIEEPDYLALDVPLPGAIEALESLRDSMEPSSLRRRRLCGSRVQMSKSDGKPFSG